MPVSRTPYPESLTLKGSSYYGSMELPFRVTQTNTHTMNTPTPKPASQRMNRMIYFRDYQGTWTKIIYPKGKTLFVHEAVVLIRQGADRFAVVYGLQTDTNLSYVDASYKLGQCLMHQAACSL